jgi:hypothetical protein
MSRGWAGARGVGAPRSGATRGDHAARGGLLLAEGLLHAGAYPSRRACCTWGLFRADWEDGGEELAGVRVLGGAEERFGWAFFYYLAFVHDGYAVG